MTRRLATFDVFDTLLTRAIGDPTSLFLLMGRIAEVRRISGCTPEEFARTRISAERRARHSRHEVSLDQIYSELAAGLCLSNDDVKTLLGVEVNLELRLSRVVPRAHEVLEGTTETRRVAVSDMYLPTAVVTQLLEQQGLMDLLDDVHVSSEHGVTKSGGGLYQLLQAKERVRARDWSHHGDNSLSDHRVPRLLGIDARHLTAAKLNRYEKIWENHRWETNGFSSLLAGASRLTRLDADVTAELEPIVTVAAGVAAPILVAYVMWVLHSARKEGLDRLYFLARDGEVLFLLAERLAERLGIDIELRYLYGSRSVYHRASLAFKSVRDAKWAWSAMYRLTPAAVLARLGLPDREAREALVRLGLHLDRPVTPAVIEKIVNDATTASEVQRFAQQLLGRVQGYLRQEGVADGTPYAIVDTGWAGRIAQSLTDVMPPEAPPLRRGYLFGYMKRDDGYGRPDILRGYLFDEYAETGFWGAFGQAYGPLETFTVANHGMTADFVEKDGRFEPSLASPTNPTLDGWPWAMFRDTLFRFVDNLVLDADLAQSSADLRAPVADVLTEFWSNPTETEARTWGSYIYEDDILAQSRNPLAAAITPKDFVGKTKRSYEGKRLWIEGSVMLSPPAVRPAARVGLWFNERRRSASRPAEFLPPRWQSRLRLLDIARKSRIWR